eukprot:CAMPEP_0172772992 /NCGR_PEP_ID=MMETSP1074-20121228/193484_1 /TAXON_ID=2916 /ORGANISM="Ceratium fusus, Strain PA161109" /LENGTH=129 /DNA_ID=CAMNT_0013609203 /DNA_START=47 /DNA_END=436 /DNA_ORIENTATION=-
MTIALILATTAMNPFVPAAAQPKAVAAPQLVLPLGLAEVLSPSPPAHAEVFPNTFTVSAPMDPGEAKEAFIDQNLSPAGAVALGVYDFIFDTAVPFFLAFGLVYVVSVAIGLTESPFTKQDDGAQDSKP